MSIIELFLDIADLIEDIRFGRRYGWGSFLWELAAFACLIAALLFFNAGLYILGAVGIIGTVACFVFGIRRLWRDMRKKQAEEVQKLKQEEKIQPVFHRD